MAYIFLLGYSTALKYPSRGNKNSVSLVTHILGSIKKNADINHCIITSKSISASQSTLRTTKTTFKEKSILRKITLHNKKLRTKVLPEILV